METITIGSGQLTVKELSAKQSTEGNSDFLRSIDPIYNACREWNKSTFELIIEQPDIFINLMAASTSTKPEFIETLPGGDFDTLAFVFLSVNAEFLMQRLMLIRLANDNG